MSTESMIINLEEILEEFRKILDNMKADNSDDVVAYFGELVPVLEKLERVIGELKSGENTK